MKNFKKVAIYLFCGLLALSSGLTDAMRRGGGRRGGGMRGGRGMGRGMRMGGMRRGGIGRAAGPRRMGMRRGGMRMGPRRGWRARRGGGWRRPWRRPYRRLRYGPRIWWGGYPYWGYSYTWDPYCTVWNPNNPYCYDGVSVNI